MRQIERVRVKGERRVGDDRGDVVGAAGTKRHRNQLLRALLLIGAGGQHLLQCGILKHAAQTVGAEQPAVGRMCLAYGDVRTRIDIEITQNAHHDVALRMVARLGLADAAGVDQMLHVAVVGRHADQTAVMQQICAGIADMRQNPISGHQCDRRDGGAHARETTFALRFANDRVMRGHNRGSIMWAIIRTSPCTLSCSICANERMAMVEAVSPPAWPPMPSQMAIRCSPANAESWLLERTVPTSETTVEYMNSGCEAGEVGKRVTSIQRWLRQCVRERAIRESSERSDAAG